MTPQFLLDAPVRDQDEETARTRLAEPTWATAAGGARITREAGARQPLVAVVGLGHAGLPSAIALRRAGFRIVGIDSSSSRLSDIRSGQAEVAGADRSDLRAHLGDEEFVLTDELEAVHAADRVLICVPATVGAQGHPSYDALTRACAAIVRHARAGQTLVLTSTTHVGSTRELLVEPLAERGLCVGEDVFVAFSPERIDAGTAPDRERASSVRVVGAVTETCFAHAAELLRPLCHELHRVSSPAAAEMVRLYESSFRAVNIALAFEMADACRTYSLDPIEVTDAAATKPVGFMAHYPSAGVGGHSVGVDPQQLLQPLRERGRPATLTEEALRTVAARPRRVAQRAHELLLRSGAHLRDVRVLVVGVTYKPGVADCTHSPAVEIISRLQEEGVQVDFHDPLVRVLRVDGEQIHGIDPDPRRDASGFGPEDYELAIVVGIQPGYDYGWLRRCPQVLDCTYRQRTGRRHFLL
ncbi:MAG: nucleotide sugar dehydrogenase [Solirubrobacteraceae bacterium]|jgi:nucleotide sugar dehydrogenase